MEDHIAIRRAVPGDASALARLWLRSRMASVPAIPPPVHDDDDVVDWMTGIVNTTQEVWVAETDQAEMVGLMVIDGRWLDQLYVDPAHLGRGIGSRLLDLAKERRPDTIELWTFQTNLPAQRFYEHHGFTPTGATDGSRNEENAPDVRLRWQGQAPT